MIEVDYNEYKETIAENMKLIVENQKLKEKYYLMRTNASQLAKRIDKAVKYITSVNLDDSDNIEDLLKILEGESKQ